ncbi:hypothetical protein E2562_007692 [Oryza meyeriana var. granulata]|uniref:DUF1618 domain-containing protein n=1 Tax=Oryza meyeriana var. granulata TaxID=110450 RepID=A0A6G1EHF4_9ORYZ|nr:hypothetical protein E2562_007692 [Oryza meyeriana var. granulata]
MSLLLRRLAGASVGRLRRPLSTAASPSRPPWAMILVQTELDRSGAPSRSARASLDLGEPPCSSCLSVPAHFVEPGPLTDPDGDTMGVVGTVIGASGDGPLLLKFYDIRYHIPVVANVRLTLDFQLSRTPRDGYLDPDITRFVCNPLSGQMYRLPAVESTKGGTGCGLLTRSEGRHGPPDRYVVAKLTNGEAGRSVLRRFLSETEEWDDLAFVPSPERVATGRAMHLDHDVLAFGGRLWWVDVSWGACSVDPFSDRPEERFVELPRGSVLPDLTGMAGSQILGWYRRMGVSEGKLRYVEVSNTEKPFVVSSFSPDDEGSCWTLEHKMEITPSWPGERKVPERPRIGAIDPLNANVLYLIFFHEILAVDMAKGEVIGRSSLEDRAVNSDSVVACVLPPWLESCQIPSRETLSSKKTDVERKTLADMLVRVDRGC